MDSYNVTMSPFAQKQLRKIGDYLRFDKGSDQAADAVSQDAVDTIETLKSAAGSLPVCPNPKLAALSYRKINFLRHRYLMYYRLDGHTVFIDGIYHQSQDHANHFIETL